MPSKLLMQAVNYCRVSSTKQVREGHGLESQDTRCREFAKHKKYNVVASFHDEGVSGSLIDRPKMQEMLAFIAKQDEPVIVLIDDISRLARGLEAHLQLRTAISDVGGKLESPSIEFGEDSDSILVENLLASVSQHQRQKNSEQVVNRMRARAMNGYWIANPTVGYKYADVEGHGKLLIRDEPTATILQQGLEQFASGRIETQTEFRNYLLSHEAFPRNKGGDIHYQHVKNILTRVLYAGYITLPKWNIHMLRGKHEPLIDFDTFERIQNRLEKGAKAPARTDLDAGFPLRGFVTCSCCGTPYTSCWSTSATQKRYAYYLCQKKGCEMKGKSVRREMIEAEFNELMKSVIPTEEVFCVTHNMLKKWWNDRSQLHIDNSEAIKVELKGVNRKIEKLVERVVTTDSIELMATYENSIKSLEKKRVALSEKIGKCGTALPDFDETFRTSLKFLSNPYELWASDDIAKRRTALKLVFVDKIPYTLKQGFRTPSIAQPLRLCNQLEGSKYDMVRMERLELSRPKPQPPQGCVSTNSTTSANNFI